MNKEIINKIDVTYCPALEYDYYNIACCILTGTGCHNNPDCMYKDRTRLQEQNKQLKNVLKEIDNYMYEQTCDFCTTTRNAVRSKIKENLND